MKLQVELAPLTIICGDNLRTVDIDYDVEVFEELFLPENNLSSKEQVELAKRLVRLVNLGSNILVITYSDYIIKELNTLIMLNYKQVDQFKDYNNGEFLDINKIKVYDIVNRVVNECNVNELGIEVPSLDNVINEMNEMQEVLSWSD